MTKDREIRQLRQTIQRIESHQEKQTEALEAVADRLEIQNAVLLELATEMARANNREIGRDPDDISTRGKAKNVENHVLNLREQVDLDAVGRVADE